MTAAVLDKPKTTAKPAAKPRKTTSAQVPNLPEATQPETEPTTTGEPETPVQDEPEVPTEPAEAEPTPEPAKDVWLADAVEAAKPKKPAKADVVAKVHEAQEKLNEVIHPEDDVELLTPAQVREKRQHLELSRAQLAQLAGINQSRAWAAEQDDKELSLGHRRAVAKALADVAANGLPAEMQTTKKATMTPAQRLKAVIAILEDAVIADDLATTRGLATDALALAKGE